MFMAVIVPEAKRNLTVMGVIAVSFLLSFLSTVIPFIKEIPNGTMIIILTVTISTFAALLFPIKVEEDECNE